MGSLRGTLASGAGTGAHAGVGAGRKGRDEDVDADWPARIGQDERRLQLLAYRYWASLPRFGGIPLIHDVTSADMADFADFMVMLDVEQDAADPPVVMLGAKLAQECDAAAGSARLSDLPAGSLLPAIVGDLAQVITDRAPIRLSAHFVNQRGSTLACRGILLPFSGDGTRIQQIMGVINWKEMADQATTAGLMQELASAFDSDGVPSRLLQAPC